MSQPNRTRPPEVRHAERGHAFYPSDDAAIPALYTTEATPLEHKTIHARYFAAWGDWYIAEYDPNTGLAFGWATVGANDEYGGEWGYIDLPALESFRAEPDAPHLVERDLHFTPGQAAVRLPKGHHVIACRNTDCPLCHR